MFMKKILKTAPTCLKILPLFLVVFTLLAAPLSGLALIDDPDTGTAPIQDLGGFETWLSSIVTYIGTIFWILTVLFLVIAAFYYLTSAGSEDKLKKAKSMLIYAIIAIVVALFASGASALISSVFDL